jgi:hypothetical protein
VSSNQFTALRTVTRKPAEHYGATSSAEAFGDVTQDRINIGLLY